MSLAIIPAYLYSLLFFLLPGFVLVVILGRKQGLRPTYALITILACGAILGYVAFWTYFASKSAGLALSYLVFACSILFLIRELRGGGAARARNLLREISLPLAYLAVTGSCYLCLLFAVADPFTTALDLMDWRFFTPLRPGDNIIPWILAAKIYARQSVIPFCCGGWLSSDRPPLQAGIFLLFWPLKAFAGAGTCYQLLATGLQCFWICAVWVLLTTLGTTRRTIVQALSLLIPASFLFYNSLYTWPKLLAATFVIFAASFCVAAMSEHRPLTTAESFLAAACVGLALMAHPGSVFSLPVFGAVVVYKRCLSWRHALLGATVLCCFYVPWSLYQRYVDPPGNRLLKMHLAGVVPIDSRTTWQALEDRYSESTRKQIFSYKWQNVARLIGPGTLNGFGVQAVRWHDGVHLDSSSLEEARVDQRETIFNAIGILNVGWLALLVALARKRMPAIPYSGWLLLIGFSNLLLWCVIIFGPSGTPVESSSYADLLIVMLGLSGFLLMLPRWVPVTVIALEVVNLLVVWLTFRPATPYIKTAIQWPLIVFGLFSGLAILSYGVRAFYPIEQRIHHTIEV
jgi:hypothetical protein